MSARIATVSRDTNETQINVSVNLDGEGRLSCQTGVPFLDHMLDQVARHGMIDLDINATGDLHIDDHHTVEDLGITLGQAFFEAIGDKRGIYRYGHAYVPLDEALSRVVIDFSGRPGLYMNGSFSKASSITLACRCISTTSKALMLTTRQKRFLKPSAERYVWPWRKTPAWQAKCPPPKGACNAALCDERCL